MIQGLFTALMLYLFTTYFLLILSSTTQATNTPEPVADGGDTIEGGDIEKSNSGATFSGQTVPEKRVS